MTAHAATARGDGPTLRLTLFGGFTLVGGDGAPVVIASRKCRALLAFLAVQPRPVSRERLASLLWADGGEARARASLRQALTTLRREVPGDGEWLRAEGDAVEVSRPSLWVDAVEAEALLRAGDAHRALEMSAAGELLAGLNAGADEFDEWRDRERRRWREHETAALRALADEARRPGRERDLLAVGRRLLKLEPWNEEAHRAVMHALAGLGRHSEALRQYQVAAEALRAELKVAPGPETEALMLQIRALRSAAAEPRASTDAPPGEVDDAAAPAVASADPLVGREVETRQLEALLQGCQASGRGHVILIRGEAGMGKTTFLQRALARARDAGFATCLVQAAEYGAGRNLEVVRGLLSALDADVFAAPAHRVAIHELSGNPLDAADAAVGAALDPDARALAHGRAVEALVAAAGARSRRIIAVEDLHWCDAETTRILCAAATAAPQHHVVMIFTCRSGEDPDDLSWAALLRRGSLTSIELGPLSPDEAARLAARHGGLDAEQTARCLERAGGHPLFLVQLLESGGDGDVVPESVQGAVLARLGRVTPDERRVLDAAAVLGAPFSAEQMARLLDRDAVVLTGLVQQGWLRPDGTRLAIAHDLLAAAIRSAVDEPTLRRLHRAAAEWFAARDPVTSAEHLERAHDPGAAPAYLSVAREAVREGRLDLAETALTRLDACPAEPAVAFEALCLRGDARRERGDAAGSHAVFARAAAQARGPEQEVRTRLGIAAALRLLDRHHEALACLDEAEKRTDAQEHATRAALEHLRGNLLFVAGDLAGCLGAHERALHHARIAESPLDEAGALSGLGDAHYLAGRLTAAGRAFAACRELARAHGILRMEAASGAMSALIAVYTNDLAAATALAGHAVEVANAIDDARLQCLAEVVAAAVALEHGDAAAARAHGERARAAGKRLGSERSEAMGINGVARALLAEGRRRDALTAARQAFTLCQRSGGLPLIGATVLATLAEAATGGEAARAISDGETLLAAGCACHNHFDLREAAIEVALDRGDPDEARRHADALEGFFPDERPARAVLVADRARAMADLLVNPRSSGAQARVAELRARARAAGLIAQARSFDRTFTPR